MRYGRVACSICIKHSSASAALSPHISRQGRSLPQTAGRSALPNTLQLLSSVNCRQRMPAGLPLGMPGIGDDMDGAIQQAAQLMRQFMSVKSLCEDVVQVQ